jgi:hypothetical protein
MIYLLKGATLNRVLEVKLATVQTSWREYYKWVRQHKNSECHSVSQNAELKEKHACHFDKRSINEYISGTLFIVV